MKSWVGDFSVSVPKFKRKGLDVINPKREKEGDYRSHRSIDMVVSVQMEGLMVPFENNVRLFRSWGLVSVGPFIGQCREFPPRHNSWSPCIQGLGMTGFELTCLRKRRDSDSRSRHFVPIPNRISYLKLLI